MVDINQWIKSIKKNEKEWVEWNSWDENKLTLNISGCLFPSQGQEELILEGKLKLGEESYSKVEVLFVQETNITDLDLSECFNLRQITVKKNLFFTSVGFLSRLPCPEKLICLEIDDNNFEPTTLDFLKPFVNLQFLGLGICCYSNWGEKEGKELVKEGIYNKFYGSLEPLQVLKKLRKLNIVNTDIDSGLEYLNGDKMDWDFFYCWADGSRPEAKVKKIYEEFEERKKKENSSSGPNRKNLQERKINDGEKEKSFPIRYFLWIILLASLLTLGWHWLSKSDEKKAEYAR